MLKQYQYTFEELNIIPSDFYELLGFGGDEMPEPFSDYIAQVLQEAPALCSILGGFRVFDSVEVNREAVSIQIEKLTFFPSKTVVTQLKNSNKAALFACTVGAGISDRARTISQQGDPMLSYVYDVLGSISVEKSTDKLQANLLHEMKQIGLGISDRYSPGYCDWNVNEQHQLFSLLPQNFCGIQLSESALMHPIKSVSGIIGIGTGLKQKGYQCEWCTDRNCIYGKIKRKK